MQAGEQVDGELETPAGEADDLSPYAAINHVRFHAPDVVYHVLFRCFQGRFLLAPDRAGKLNDVIAGVVGRAQEIFAGVRLYAHAFLSNHGHLMLQGPPEQIPAFVGFVKREISRRWGGAIGWTGAMWEDYRSTALPTPQSQAECFKYVLSQGVKEGLVASPLQWPGVHCAQELAEGGQRSGVWLDATAFGKARHRERAKERPRAVRRRDYERRIAIRLDRLPCFAHLDDAEHRAHVQDILGAIEAEGAAERGDRPVLGRRGVFAQSREQRSELPHPPWHEDRRRMLHWSARNAPETRAYLARYWRFQRSFRAASDRYRAGDLSVRFPRGAFRPSLYAGRPSSR